MELLTFIVGTPMKKKLIRDVCTSVCDSEYTGSDAFVGTRRSGTDDFGDGDAPAVGFVRLSEVTAAKALAVSLLQARPAGAAAEAAGTDMAKVYKGHTKQLRRDEVIEATLVANLIRLGCDARRVVAARLRLTRSEAVGAEVVFLDDQGKWTDWRVHALAEDQKSRRIFAMEVGAETVAGIAGVLDLPNSHPVRRDMVVGVAVAHRAFDTEASIRSVWEKEMETDAEVRAALKLKYADEVAAWSKRKKERETEATIRKAAAEGRKGAGAGPAVTGEKRTRDTDAGGAGQKGEGGAPQEGRKARRKAAFEKAKASLAGPAPTKAITNSPAGTPTGKSTTSRVEAEAMLASGTKVADLPFSAIRALGICQVCGVAGHIGKTCPSRQAGPREDEK